MAYIHPDTCTYHSNVMMIIEDVDRDGMRQMFSRLIKIEHATNIHVTHGHLRMISMCCGLQSFVGMRAIFVDFVDIQIKCGCRHK